jgi:predicted phosphohydrolase
MALYVIGDLHLSLSDKINKPMDIFGDNWTKHDSQLKSNWQATENDTTVIAGDVSWAMDFAELEPDFSFIDSLPGKKIILKGNHDYWWTTMRKMNAFAANFSTISFLHNNSFLVDGVSVCGTRGWITDPDEPQDEKILMREVGRLEESLKNAESENRIVFLHYPPITAAAKCGEILSVLSEYGIKRCYYGHLHGKAIKGAYNGDYAGTDFRLVSADYLGFKPLKIDTNMI